MIKRILSFLLTLVICSVSVSLIVYADDYTYSTDDINVLQSILSYGNNADELGWDLDYPEDIGEVAWDVGDDNQYHLYEINLSNIDVTGPINLSFCQYLEDVNFANTSISEIILPASVVELGRSAFSNCSSLIYVEFNSEEMTIGKNAFSGCTSLKTVLNVESIVSVGSNAFKSCKKVKFYGSSIPDVIKNVASEYRFSYSTNYTVSAYCYVGIMVDRSTDYVDLDTATAYHTAYLTNDYGTFYADEDGRIDFYINLGSRQSAVIDGATALTRNVTSDILYNNYPVSTENKAIGIVVCNYVKDSLINGRDFAALIRYTIGSNTEEEYCYDLNENGSIDSNDKAYFNEFLNTVSDGASQFYKSWR